MYSDKKNILQLIASFTNNSLQYAVVCPGSRNAPIVQTLVTKGFTCYEITDERSAGFFALGLAQQHKCPVVICCTSGSALLNLSPAVAEAYYQPLPLIVVSADRPQAWIGQMDGQTLPQHAVFGSLVRKSVTLPEPINNEDEWYCNRMINEALMTAIETKGPVHINVPISEPLFNFTITELPCERYIVKKEIPQDISSCDALNNLFGNFEGVMVGPPLIIIGQLLPEVAKRCEPFVKLLISKYRMVVLCEALSNISTNETEAISNFDDILYVNSDGMVPYMAMTLGGHIVSKRLKKFIRENKIKEHWHVSRLGEVNDIFQKMNVLIEAEPYVLLEAMVNMYRIAWKSSYESICTPYYNLWQERKKEVEMRLQSFDYYKFSDLYIVKKFFEKLPDNSVLQVANSSMVRNIQLFDIPSHCKVYCNRGVNGIEGTLSTAVGYAANKKEELVFVMIGDLSFFYDQNALWNQYLSPSLRILLINNGGGQIFHHLPGLKASEIRDRYIAGAHTTTAQGIAKQSGCCYLQARTRDELNNRLIEFTDVNTTDVPIILEVFTDSKTDEEIYKNRYHYLRGN